MHGLTDPMDFLDRWSVEGGWYSAKQHRHSQYPKHRLRVGGDCKGKKSTSGMGQKDFEPPHHRTSVKKNVCWSQ